MLHHHPAWAIENIGSMVRWNEAFWIAYQHQERCDGSGYPEGTLGNDICAGAQMIGIADTFYSIMSRNRQRSILRSIAEINACSNREFSPHWVEIFNRTIRIQQMAGGI
jgi:response regulator RpfG family c-di-GMP phosphodiesterase